MKKFSLFWVIMSCFLLSGCNSKSLNLDDVKEIIDNHYLSYDITNDGITVVSIDPYLGLLVWENESVFSAKESYLDLVDNRCGVMNNVKNMLFNSISCEYIDNYDNVHYIGRMGAVTFHFHYDEGDNEAAQKVSALIKEIGL